MKVDLIGVFEAICHTLNDVYGTSLCNHQIQHQINCVRCVSGLVKYWFTWPFHGGDALSPLFVSGYSSYSIFKDTEYGIGTEEKPTGDT